MIRAAVRGIPVLLLSVGALVSAGVAQTSSKEPSDYVNTLVGTAPPDQQKFIGNAPPPGEPVYSGQTSSGGASAS